MRAAPAAASSHLAPAPARACENHTSTHSGTQKNTQTPTTPRRRATLTSQSWAPKPVANWWVTGWLPRHAISPAWAASSSPTAAHQWRPSEYLFHGHAEARPAHTSMSSPIIHVSIAPICLVFRLYPGCAYTDYGVIFSLDLESGRLQARGSPRLEL